MRLEEDEDEEENEQEEEEEKEEIQEENEDEEVGRIQWLTVLRFVRSGAVLETC